MNTRSMITAAITGAFLLIGVAPVEAVSVTGSDGAGGETIDWRGYTFTASDDDGTTADADVNVTNDGSSNLVVELTSDGMVTLGTSVNFVNPVLNLEYDNNGITDHDNFQAFVLEGTGATSSGPEDIGAFIGNGTYANTTIEGFGFDVDNGVGSQEQIISDRYNRSGGNDDIRVLTKEMPNGWFYASYSRSDASSVTGEVKPSYTGFQNQFGTNYTLDGVFLQASGQNGDTFTFTDFDASSNAAPVPAPAAGVLGLVGFGLLALRRRRRNEAL